MGNGHRSTYQALCWQPLTRNAISINIPSRGPSVQETVMSLASFLPLQNYAYYIYRVFQEEGTKHWESVPYVKIYRYNPKHLCPKLNGYGDNCQRKVWSSGGSTHCTLSADRVPHVYPTLPCQITEIPLTLLRQYSTTTDYACHV
jgi:hypothetical protein